MTLNHDTSLEEEVTDDNWFFEFVVQEQKDLLNLMRTKNADYTAGAGPFANFECSKEFGVAPLTGLLLRLSDKFQRLKSFARTGALQVPQESVDDAFRDIIGYSYIALGMLNEQKEIE